MTAASCVDALRKKNFVAVVQRSGWLFIYGSRYGPLLQYGKQVVSYPIKYKSCREPQKKHCEYNRHEEDSKRLGQEKHIARARVRVSS